MFATLPLSLGLRRRLVVLVTACLVVGLAIVSPLVAQPSSAAPFPCSEGSHPAELDLVWRQLPDETSQVRPSGSTLDLRVGNDGDQVLFVELSVAAVLDDLRETQTLGTVVVPAHGSLSVPVDLASFSLLPHQLDFSGRLSAKGVARADQGAPVAVVAYSPAIYFHEEELQLHAYREQPMRDDYQAGDFANRAVKLRAWADARGLRVTGIGYYSDLPLTDDDGGPPGATPDPPRHSGPNPDQATSSNTREVTK